MSKIELKDITLDYTDQGNVYHALDGVTFSVEEGEFVSLIGSSGCGKSTTLSILAGLNNPKNGSFLIDGQETRGTGKDRGVVFQHYSLFPWMSVRKNIEFGIKQNFPRLSKKELTAKATEYLEKVGLKGFENKYPYQLSGGMQQRAAIARTLAMETDILFMEDKKIAHEVKVPFARPRNREKLTSDEAYLSLRRKVVDLFYHEQEQKLEFEGGEGI